MSKPRSWRGVVGLLLCAGALCLYGCAAGKTITLDWPRRMKIDHAVRATGCCISPDGKALGLVSEDHAVFLVDESSENTPRWTKLRLLPKRLFKRPTSVKFTRDGKQLLVYNVDDVARVDVATGEFGLYSAARRGSDVMREASAVSPDGKHRAVGFMHGSLEVYEIETEKRVLAMEGHKDVERIVADYASMALIYVSPTRGTSKITAMSYSADGTLLATGDNMGGIRVWDTTTGRKAVDLVDKNLVLMQRVLWLELSPDKRFLAAGTVSDAAEKITLFDLARKAKIAELTDVSLCGLWLWSPDNPLPADILTDFSRDGRYFLYPRKKDIVVYDVQQRKVVKILTGHTENVTSLAVSPDGTWLCSLANDRTGRLWDLASGKCVTVFVGLPEGEYVYLDLSEGKLKVYESPKAKDYCRNLN